MQSNNILVTGGGGYIGGFMVKRLLKEGYNVIVADSLERGKKENIDSRADFRQGDILNRDFLVKLFDTPITAVIHFAGLISVGESMQHPDDYFRINTMGSLLLLEQMKAKNINKLIFSSSAAVYGNPQKIPIPEDHPKNPESPYGMSKLLVENGLSWYFKSFGISSVSLRYFNAAGAALDGSQGEQHTQETHLIPNIFKSMLKKSKFLLNGDDYQTPDGTCVRDYIHVLDLVEAHVLALRKLNSSYGAYNYNVGTGNGYSIMQVISMAKQVSQLNLEIEKTSKRQGDASILVADNTKIKNELRFQPKYSDLETIIASSWSWHNKKA